jgi:hypothetical protein
MADADWHYLENQFDNATKKSRKRMKSIGQQHKDSLSEAPATIKAALIARITPPFDAFLAKYNVWVNLKANRKGAVLVFEGLLEHLSAVDIEDIETEFKGVYKRDTPQHTTAFAGGRAPYQEGSDDDRVDALVALQGRIQELADENPALDGTVDLVATAVTNLQAARTAANGFETKVELARTQIEPLRKALAVALYKNLGALMGELGPDEQIAAYFDLELLRETGPDEEDPDPITPPSPPTP